jgi:serralysin
MSMHAHLPDDLDGVFAPPPDDFTGTAGNDKIHGTNGEDSFDMSQGGNDKVVGKGGNDFFDFGDAFTAHDKIDGGAGIDSVTLVGDYSAGVVFNAKTMVNIEFLNLAGSIFDGGGSYNLTIADSTAGKFLSVLLNSSPMYADSLSFDASAETSADIFVQNGGAGTNHIVTGGGNDHVSSGRVTDGGSFDGGAGYDFISFGSVGFGITFSLLEQGHVQDVGGGHEVMVSNFEAFSGTPNADVLVGDDNDNFILPGGGNDNVQANGGNDFVSMDDFVPYTAITVDGGSGVNTLSFQAATVSGVTFSLALQGSAQATGQGDGVITATGFVNLEGSDVYDDHLTGDGAANQILGGGGNDTLAGGNGNDTLYGDGFYMHDYTDIGQVGYTSGFTVIQDGNGTDTLDGGAGNDKLVGGLGVDTLTGDTGADKFVFETVQDSGVGAGNRDVITDFSHTDGDKIDLHLIDADTTLNGDQAFHLGGSSFTHSAGELIQFSDGSGNTILAGDVNGDGVADFEIQLAHAPVLVTGDFVL